MRLQRKERIILLIATGILLVALTAVFFALRRNPIPVENTLGEALQYPTQPLLEYMRTMKLSLLIGSGVICFILGGFLYFLPTFFAATNHKSKLLAILALNVFLGWTFLGWIAALLWALTTEPQSSA